MTTFSEFSKQVLGWRESVVSVGDTLAAIALREMGDANQWVALVHLNGLRHPYLVATLEEKAAQPGTLCYGDRIKIPAARRVYTAVTDTESVYGQDVGLWHGRVRIVNGDFDVRAGLANLKQAIQHRVSTEPGEILRHPEYGCHVRAVLGEKYNPVIRALAQAFVVEAMEAEPRVSRVSRVDIENSGDVLGLSIGAIPITGDVAVSANLVFPVV